LYLSSDPLEPSLTGSPFLSSPLSLNAKISLEEFKFIFYMEWAHRNLGRLIGVVFVLPGIYFAARGRLSSRDRWKVLALAGGIGFQVGRVGLSRLPPRSSAFDVFGDWQIGFLIVLRQGFLGWYMVSSGLDADHLSARPNSTPRVSQYRLAAHLGAALVLYVGMMHTALAARQDWKVAHPELAKEGVVVKEVIQSLARQNAFRRCAWGVAGLVLLTAVSG
jgi:cytochrome c oxidase assembly protein subunit 15